MEITPLLNRFLEKNYYQKNGLTDGEAILGNIIQFGDSEYNFFTALSSDDFFLPHEKFLFDTLLSMQEADEGISLPTVALKVKDLGNQSWTVQKLLDIASTDQGNAPVAMNMKVFLDRLKRIKISLVILDSAEKLMGSIGTVHTNPFEPLEKHLAEMNELACSSPTGKREIVWSQDMWAEYLQDLEAQMTNPDKNRQRLYLGLDSFDSILPMSRTNFVILAGRPSIGKTSSVLYFIDNLSRANPDAVGIVISLEMELSEIAAKRAAATGSINILKLKEPETLDVDECDRLIGAIGKISKDEWNRVAYSRKGVNTVSDIRREIRRIKAKQGKCDWVVIDYLGLLKAEGSGGKDLYHKVTQISGDLKRLAREEGVLILCLAQLNREQAKAAMVDGKKPKPELKDLRDSGAIEQDADAIIFIHRDNYFSGDKIYGKNDQQTMVDDTTYLCIRKNRHGTQNRIDIPFAYDPVTGKMTPKINDY